MNKLKIILTFFVAVICVLCIPVSSNATNEELVIVEEASNQYIIYIKQYLNKEFEFAFSNDNEANPEQLTFYNSALDAPEEGANNIAYVDDEKLEMFDKTTYMWIKVDGKLKVTAREINIEDNITKKQLESVGKTSTIIPVNLEQIQTVNQVNEEGTKITETVGVVKLNEEFEGQYQLIKRETSKNTDNLFALAELIEKNEFTDSYTKIKASKEFIELYNKLYDSLDSESWKAIEESIIQQPVDTQTGDQYILWVKGDNTQDIHFLTSYREYDEEFVQEEVKTKLPYTYDNNIMIIILGIVVVAIILVTIRIVILKKKEMSK